MRYTVMLFFAMITLAVNGQEIGVVKVGDNVIELHKSNHLYSCFYSDTSVQSSQGLKSFEFPNIDRVYAIIMEGFENEKDHKTYLLTNKDTVVKFEFSRINGVVQLIIKHNNLIDNTIGATAHLNKEQISQLFGVHLVN